jgi:hypothetical protein
MLKRSGEEAEGALQELQSPLSVPGTSCGSHDRAYSQPWRSKIKVRAPSRHEPQVGLAPSLKLPVEAPRRHLEATGDKPRKLHLHLRPIVPVIAALLLGATASGGFIYLGYASHFESPPVESSGGELNRDELRPDGLWLYLASTRHGRMSPLRLLEVQKAQAFQQRL